MVKNYKAKKTRQDNPLQKPHDAGMFKLMKLPLDKVWKKKEVKIPGYTINIVAIKDASGNFDYSTEVDIYFENHTDAIGLPCTDNTDIITAGFDRFFVGLDVAAAAGTYVIIAVGLAPGVSFKYKSNRSEGLNTINTVNTVDNLTKVGRVGYNGPLDLQDLGANGSIKYATLSQVVSTTPSTTTTTMYTVPVGKKAYLIHASISALGDHTRTEINLYENANTIVRHGTQSVNEEADTPTPVVIKPHIIKDKYLTAGQTYQLNQIRSASSPGGTVELRASIIVWECDE